MPPANNDRQHNKRELERCVGNIAWSVQHLQTVFGAFYEAGLALAESGNDVPESYTQTMAALETAIDGLMIIAEAVKEVNETI